MAKTVFDNWQAAHVWAQQEQEQGRSHNGNLWFQGPTIYSYRTPIARVYRPWGGAVVLLTSESFSVTTTGKHMVAVRRAIGHYGWPIVVPYIDWGHSTGRQRGPRLHSEEALHVANMAWLTENAASSIERIFSYKASQCFRSRGPLDPHSMSEESLKLAVEETFRRAREYATIFAVDFPTSVASELSERCSSVAEAFRADLLKLSTPAAIAKRERALEKKREEELRKEAKRQATKADILGAWLAGDGAALPGTDHAGRAYCRIAHDVLETSLGASVPLAHAIRVFRFVRECRAGGRTWRRNGQTLRVGHFQVDAIEADGSFRAGCHTFAWPEIARVAALLGLGEEHDGVSVLPDRSEARNVA